jgi:hypothetical protein
MSESQVSVSGNNFNLFFSREGKEIKEREREREREPVLMSC